MRKHKKFWLLNEALILYQWEKSKFWHLGTSGVGIGHVFVLQNWYWKLSPLPEWKVLLQCFQDTVRALMASPTQWTWVWVNFGCWWWTRRHGVLQCMGSQRVRHDWATELNWTEFTLMTAPWQHELGESEGGQLLCFSNITLTNVTHTCDSGGLMSQMTRTA